MYIINLTYKVSIETVDHYLTAHIEYLNNQYKAGYFLASGRKIPRSGGVILSNVQDRETLQTILHQDPFYVHAVADYDIIEFVPSKTCDQLNFLKQD